VKTDEFNDSHGFFDAISQLPNDDAISQLPNDDAISQLPNDDAISQLSNDDAMSQLPNDDAVGQLTNTDLVSQLPSDLSMSVLEGMTQDWVSSPLVASTPRYHILLMYLYQEFSLFQHCIRI
jgi:hypothetical protein